MEKNKTAFSLVEVIFVVVFVGICAAITVPRLDYSIISRKKAEITARRIVTDLRLARRLAISDAADNTTGYELNMLGSSPYTGYEIENRDTGETVDSHTIDSGITCTSDKKKFEFLPLGNLKPGTGTEITVSAEGKSFTITINPATGMIKCIEN